MSAAPAGAQAGAARCCHRAKSFGLAVGYAEVLTRPFHIVNRQKPS